MTSCQSVSNKSSAYVFVGGATASQTDSTTLLKNIQPYNQNAKSQRQQWSNSKYLLFYWYSEKALILQGCGIVKLNLEYADIICKTTKKLKDRAYAATNGLWINDSNDKKPLDREVLLANPDFAQSRFYKQSQYL